MVPPAFDDTELTFSLFEAHEFFFSDMQVAIDCGGITQELVYQSGPLGAGYDISNDYLVTGAGLGR